jgi:hypothetical protein
MSRRLTHFPTGVSRLMGLMLVAAVSACGNSQATAPNAAVPTPVDPVRESNLVVDPLDSLTVTHTFNELSPQRCFFGDSLPNPYEGLTFESTPYFASCPSPDPADSVSIIPANPVTLASLEVVMDLPRPAVSASMDIYDVDDSANVVILNAYDGSGNLVASESSSTKNAWVTLTVTGNFQRLGIVSRQGTAYIDNLTTTFAPTVKGPTTNGPTSPEACKNGGWAQFGFRNQGQCVSFVETGKRR